MSGLPLYNPVPGTELYKLGLTCSPASCALPQAKKAMPCLTRKTVKSPQVGARKTCRSKKHCNPCLLMFSCLFTQKLVVKTAPPGSSRAPSALRALLPASLLPGSACQKSALRALVSVLAFVLFGFLASFRVRAWDWSLPLCAAACRGSFGALLLPPSLAAFVIAGQVLKGQPSKQ